MDQQVIDFLNGAGADAAKVSRFAFWRHNGLSLQRLDLEVLDHGEKVQPRYKCQVFGGEHAYTPGNGNDCLETAVALAVMHAPRVD